MRKRHTGTEHVVQVAPEKRTQGRSNGSRGKAVVTAYGKDTLHPDGQGSALPPQLLLMILPFDTCLVFHRSIQLRDTLELPDADTRVPPGEWMPTMRPSEPQSGKADHDDQHRGGAPGHSSSSAPTTADILLEHLC
jgi:hypothetical protein